MDPFAGYIRETREALVAWQEPLGTPDHNGMFTTEPLRMIPFDADRHKRIQKMM